jgi:hypothetical protein
MAKNKETRTVQLPALLAVGARPDVLIWRQQSGLFRQFEAPHAPVRVGTPGMADSLAVVSVTITPEMVGKTIGVAVAPEFKTATGRQSPGQRAWQAAFEARGGIYRLIRSAADMLALVEDVQHGRW